MFGSRRFRDRNEAGRLLANRLAAFQGRPDVLVLALPRGGVPVAAEVARALDAPLDIFLVRKLGLPGQEELAMGAIASGGVRVVNEEVVQSLDVPDEVIEAAVADAQRELERRERLYRDGRATANVRARIVILVDDGLATGSTMRAAIAALRRRGPDMIIVAVPVGAVSTCEELRALADGVVCLMTPDPLYAVGVWYEDFTQVTDEDVRRILSHGSTPHPAEAV
jgi:predicted phosphoribosyltransferase